MVDVRPINKYDVIHAKGQVTSVMTLDEDNSVESDELFGSYDSLDPEREDNTIYTRKSYIKLAIPVINFLLAEKKFTYWHKLFPDVDIEGVANGQVVYDTVRGCELHASSIGDKVYTPDILIGGQYLRYLAENLDVDARIHETMLELAKIPFCDAVNYRCTLSTLPEDFGYITENDGQYFILDRYYFNTKYTVNPKTFCKAIESIVQEELLNYTCIIPILFSLRDDITRLTDQVQEILMVLPKGYRQTTLYGKHKLTVAYDRIVRLNNDLYNTLLRYNVKLDTVRTGYIELVKQVKHVTVENQDLYDPTFKSVFETMKGKTGLVRGNMQGARTDYSGRAVIIVDPEMSIDTVGIPETMIERMMELRCLKEYQTRSSNKSEYFKLPLYERIRRAKEALEGQYATVGRQPTLYRLGLQSYKVKAVPGNAIVLSPLATPAYNADFDGDQMHTKVPIGEKAQEEVKRLMFSMNNLFLGRSGDCHIAPRQEILYGIWIAWNIEAKGKGVVAVGDTAEGRLRFLEDVCAQRVNIYDKAIFEGKEMTAGQAALRCCFSEKYRWVKCGAVPIEWQEPASSMKPDGKLTKGWCEEILKEIAINEKSSFVETVNRLVKFGFAIAEIYTPSVPVLNYPDVSDLYEEFEKKISRREEYYNRGFEPELTYISYYNKACDELDEKVKEAVMAKMDPNSGFKLMAESKARGSIDNLKQSFGMKGRIIKNSSEVFNAIIKTPLIAQMTSTEHHLCAYGTRQGLIDKSIATYKPGYISRMMSHCCSYLSITSEDCGTTEGMVLDYDFIKQFISDEALTGEEVADNRAIQKYICRMLVGRYVVGEPNLISNKKEAKAVYTKYVAEVSKDADGNSILVKKSGVALRSPLTCKKPCCVKCYGINLGTNTMAVPGLPIGFEAATSIGEPGTQLTMKKFQTGGVAGAKNLTGDFDMLYSYLCLHNLKKGSQPLVYDYLSPVEGAVETVSLGNGVKKLTILAPNSKGKIRNVLSSTVMLYDDVSVKDYVRAGESIQQRVGKFNMQEVLRLRGTEYAKKYLTVLLYDIFQEENYVDLKHFETLVSGMVFYVCTKGNEHFKAGHYYMNSEYYAYDSSDCEFFTTMKGLHDVPLFRDDVFSTMFMENMGKGISRAILLSGKDDLKLPIVRYSFGLPLEMGSAVPGYLENRGG